MNRQDLEGYLRSRLRDYPEIGDEHIESMATGILGLIPLEVAPYSEGQETRFRALKEASGVLTPTYGLAAALSPSPERQRAKALVETVDWVLHGPNELNE